MSKTLQIMATALLALSLPTSAYAGCTTNTIGSTAYTNCSDGTSFQANKIGDTTYYNGDVQGSSNTIGGTTYHNLNGVSGTSNTIGNTTYHNFNNGVSGSSNQIGGTTYSNYNNGHSSTANRIGDTLYSNGR